MACGGEGQGAGRKVAVATGVVRTGVTSLQWNRSLAPTTLALRKVLKFSAWILLSSER